MEWRSRISDKQEEAKHPEAELFTYPQFAEEGREFLAFFQERVYVFTSGPHAGVLDLPTGSTPIDVAYHIHTEVGHRCRGAKVNGRLVPLNYQLKNGEQVEILTAKRDGPSRDWLNPQLGYVLNLSGWSFFAEMKLLAPAHNNVLPLVDYRSITGSKGSTGIYLGITKKF